MIYPANLEDKIDFAAVRADVRDRCLCALGEALCDEMTFCSDATEVRRRLDCVEEMGMALRADKPFVMDRLHDSTPSLKALEVEGNWLSAKEFMSLRSGLEMMDSIRRFFKVPSEEISSEKAGAGAPYPELSVLTHELSSFPELVRSINTVIDGHGEVRDNASVALADIRRGLRSMAGSIASALRRVMRKAVEEGILEPDATPSVRDGRQVIPVSPMYKRKIPGIVHDESASGKTFFIEPAEVVEANNRLRELEIEEQREIIRILSGLSASMRPCLPEMLLSYRILGQLDFIRAKALYAIDRGCNKPNLSRDPEIDWYGAFHPVLREVLGKQGREIVKLNISLTPAKRMLVVSGPNAGGKSVVLKTVAIVQYMAQCGLTPPLDSNSHVGVFDSIFMDIGDDQSIEDDLSTYSSHLRGMKLFLQKADSRSMALIDEFGAGTEPRIGGAIAEAILKKLAARGTWGVITTHFQNLKELAEDTPGLVNGSMLYDRQRMKPMFKLSVGTPGSSFAIEIARQTGLPEDVLADVEQIVGKGYLDMDRYLMDINRDRRYWGKKRADIHAKEKKIDALLEKYESDALELRSKRRELIDEARNQAKEIIAGTNAAIERTILEIRRSQAEKQATREARERLKAEQSRTVDTKDSDNSEIIEKALKAAGKNRRHKGPNPAGEISAPLSPELKIEPGSNVLLDGRGEPGRVISLEGKNALVAFGNLKTSVALSRLRLTMKKTSSGTSDGSTFVSRSTYEDDRSRQLNFSQEIDVRGMRAAEAVQAVTYFIDDAVRFNTDRVRILHGTGTGALRQYIREYLNAVPEVRNYHDEDVRFGGAGITVVEF